ncbi:hypothetical protein [Pedobacter sp. GR22-6]|uniref:hypothetical protein n=1 Tax=Pedobacter sp. GR22-6 TaxID=3127957 RepID=UPI00307E0917
MNDQSKEEALKLKNSQISVWMILINSALLLIYLNYGYLTEDEKYLNILLFVLGLLVLIGGFAFSYHGKGYNIAKWIFGLMLVITLLMVAMAVYVTGLGKAFQH